MTINILRFAFAVLVLSIPLGCGTQEEVTVRDNPAPPPGVDALQTDQG
ncbi:hypothetical protein NG895_15850 [Aeoliella sp. ICT_H6.2]|uniref:Uncharacterized protein n=1 Tax=Aeoliella straminimaris TaxID=2954799 RepID=A0A9X2FC16_9BACT|nr:hypothetical protein [Aeoliella straminimaris]MCO6045383.1 hypothetical protein [Aeoliella straminimaris]